MAETSNVSMKPHSNPHPPLRVTSEAKIWALSAAAAMFVFCTAIFFQWLIYDDWLHNKGLRVVGSVLAAGLTFAVALRWQFGVRWRKVELLQRFESIKWMNDRIRNSLQAIECITFAADPHATESVRNAVDAIEDVLHEVLAESHPARVPAPVKQGTAARSLEAPR